MIIRLPSEPSRELPSRGMVMVEGTINGKPFTAALEPDGAFSHWFRVDHSLAQQAGIQLGASVTIDIAPMPVWTRPDAPEDLRTALATSEAAQMVWEDITPASQWEWIRWIRATRNPDTRAHRIDVALSKMNAGKRRPCCFNRNACSEPYVSKNWILLDPVDGNT